MAPPVDVDTQNHSSIHENLTANSSQDCGGPLMVNTNFLSNAALNSFLDCSNEIQKHEMQKKQRNTHLQRRPSLNRAVMTREEIFEVSTLDEEAFLRALEDNGANSSSVLQSDLTKSIENLMKYFDEDVSFENNLSSTNLLNSKIVNDSKSSDSVKSSKSADLGKLTGAIPKIRIISPKIEESEQVLTPKMQESTNPATGFKFDAVKKASNEIGKDPETPVMNFINNEQNTIKKCPKDKAIIDTAKPKNLYEHLVNPLTTKKSLKNNQTKTKSLYDDYKKNFDLISSSDENLSIKSLNKKSKISPRIKQFAEIFDRQFSPIKNMKFFENNAQDQKPIDNGDKLKENKKILAATNLDSSKVDDAKKNPVPLPRLSMPSSPKEKLSNNTKYVYKELANKFNTSDKNVKLSVKDKISLFNKIVEDKNTSPCNSLNNSKVEVIKASQKKAIQDSLMKIEQTLRKMTLKQLDSKEQLNSKEKSPEPEAPSSSSSRNVSKVKQQIESLNQLSSKQTSGKILMNSSLDSLTVNPTAKNKCSSEVFQNLQRVIEDLRTKVKEPKKESQSCENITEHSHKYYYKPISLSYILNDTSKRTEIDENHVKSLEMVCDSTLNKKIRERNNAKLKESAAAEERRAREFNQSNAECNSFNQSNSEALKKEVEVTGKRNSNDMCSCIPIDVYGPPKKIRRTAEDRINFVNPKMAKLFYEWLKLGNKFRFEKNAADKSKSISNDPKDRKSITIPMGFHTQQRIKLKKNSLRRRLRWKHDSSIIEKLSIPPSEDERSAASSSEYGHPSNIPTDFETDEKPTENQLNLQEASSARDSFLEIDPKLFVLSEPTPLKQTIPDGRDSFIEIDSNLTRCCDSPARIFKAYTLTAMSSPTPSDERYSLSSKNDLFPSRSWSHLPSGEYESFRNENFIELPEPQIRYNAFQKWPYLNFSEDHIESITVDSEEMDLKSIDLDENLETGRTVDENSEINISYYGSEIPKTVTFDRETTEPEKNCKQFRKTPKKPATFPIKPKPINKNICNQSQITIKISNGNNDVGLSSSWSKLTQCNQMNKETREISKFWIRSRSFRITINVFNVKIDEFRQLHVEMQKEQCSGDKKLKFGIDDVEFCSKKPQLSTTMKLPKHSSIYWFSVGQYKTSFEGEYMPKKKIHQIFDLLKGSAIEFGIDVGNSYATPKHSSNSDISIPDSNYHTLSPKREKRKSPLKTPNKFLTATAYNRKTSDLEPSEFESDDPDFKRSPIKNSNSKTFNFAAKLNSCSSDDNGIGHHYDSVYSDDGNSRRFSSEIELDPLDDLFKWVQKKTCETEAKIKKNGSQIQKDTVVYQYFKNKLNKEGRSKSEDLSADVTPQGIELDKTVVFRGPGIKEAVVNEAEITEAEVTEAEVKEAEVKEAEVKEAEAKEAETKEAVVKHGPEAKEVVIKEAEVKPADVEEARIKVESMNAEPKGEELNKDAQFLIKMLWSKMLQKTEPVQQTESNQLETEFVQKLDQLEKLHNDLAKILQLFKTQLQSQHSNSLSKIMDHENFATKRQEMKLPIYNLCKNADQYLQDTIKNCKDFLDMDKALFW